MSSERTTWRVSFGHLGGADIRPRRFQSLAYSWRWHCSKDSPGVVEPDASIIGRMMEGFQKAGKMRISNVLLLTLTTAIAGCPTSLAGEKQIDVKQRLDDSAAVFSEIMATPDKGIPQDILERAYCVVIVPGLKKGAFIVGAKYGKGFLSCRGPQHRGWSAPGAVRVEGGSFGFQIGGSETDVVLLVMNQRGADKLVSSQFTLGGEGEVAAGPVGRSASAQTDAKMTAAILSWSRSRGVFAGIALQGATLRQDIDDNEALYRRRIENHDIVKTGIAPPPAAQRLLSLLKKYSFREKA